MKNNVISLGNIGFIVDIDFSHGDICIETTEGEFETIHWSGFLDADIGASVLYRNNRLIKVISGGEVISGEEYCKRNNL